MGWIGRDWEIEKLYRRVRQLEEELFEYKHKEQENAQEAEERKELLKKEKELNELKVGRSGGRV